MSCCLRSLLLLCLFQTANSLFETVGCFWSARAMIPLLFDFTNYDYYDTVFRDDSVLAFAQAGEYVGPEDIAEYITSVDSNVSPFLAFGAKVSSLWPQFIGFNEDENQCVFRLFATVYSETDPELTKTRARGWTTIMFKIMVDKQEEYVKRMHAFFYPGFVERGFGDEFVTDAAREYVCNVANSDCAGYIPPIPNCEADMASLEGTEGELAYIDGNTQGCRFLHVIFAQSNPANHCAHISIDPVMDPQGQFKCQTSEGTVPLDLFTQKDLDAFDKYSTLLGFDPESGYRPK